MASNFRQSEIAANVAVDAVCALLNGGKLRIYDGPQPSSADRAVGQHVMLAELRFGRPAFGAASGGVAIANALSQDPAAAATGTATWFRALTSRDVPVFDGSIGTSGADLNLNSTAIQRNAVVAISGVRYALPKSA